MSEIKHIGNCPERRSIWNPREIAYAEEWETVNHEHRYLILLLNQSGNDSFCSGISQRDAFVAATIIQWLGTNIGQGFIEKCQQRIEKEKLEYQITQDVSVRLRGLPSYHIH